MFEFWKITEKECPSEWLGQGFKGYDTHWSWNDGAVFHVISEMQSEIYHPLLHVELLSLAR
ncbi:hypothetical protein TUMSATVNIG3_30040 [Vibrio nigripulchritudo]|nr:hypothetical protein TUMSATVNIG2_29530 [Vibrio nigripulchritudo]BDU44206.1 hypothetical protein TUMSATVNIG3_30040 [Vibrio nigripulchritudo]